MESSMATVSAPAARRETSRIERSSQATSSGASQSWTSPAAVRELVESVVVAFVLAFLFRTFEAEAFVIPTGSMAPTLMGRHRDVRCAKCGFPYQVNASSEVDARTNQLTGQEVVSGTCPNCRFTMDIGPGNPQRGSYPSYKGDRIIVTKFPYQFGEPDRWDVAVFKYPGGAKTNYIKRMVGTPNETLYIRHGDLLTRPDNKEEAAIAQKSPEKILAMMQTVYDNDYVVPALVGRGLPARWTPASVERPQGQWKVSEDMKSFRTDGSSPGDVWLHYRHFVPGYSHWKRLQAGEDLLLGSVRGQLITDFAQYNTEGIEPRRRTVSRSDDARELGKNPGPDKLGLHWVGDLILECTVHADKAGGHFLLTLVKAGSFFRCEIDLASGQAALSVDGLDRFHATAATKCRGPGTHNVRFANVDQRLTLWIDGSPVSFDAPTSYWPLNDSRPEVDDLEPARIGSRHAAVRVSHVKLFRDIYYIAQRGSGSTPMCDYDLSSVESLNAYGAENAEERMAAFFSDPAEWDVFRQRREVEFHLSANQFLMLGDNSAESMDSRLWEQRGPQYYVDRDLLIGKAMVIYWPHSWDAIPGTAGTSWFPNGVWFPMFPNFARMGAVR